MSTNLITTDVQALEIPEGILDLFELEYNDSTTLYFHPGVDSTVRVTSVDGAVVKLNRAQTFTDNAQLTFTGLDNEHREEVFEDLWAICIQHEIDHLDGKLFIDYLGPMKRSLITRKMNKLKKELSRKI